MGIVIGFYVIIICVMIRLLYWGKKEEVQTGTADQSWRLNWNRKIYYPPQHAKYYGNEPRESYSQVIPSLGVISVVDDQIVFVARGENHESSIDLSQLRWIGAYNILALWNGSVKQKKSLFLQYEDQKGWHVATFVIANENHLLSLLRVIETRTGLISQYKRNDFGPHSTQRMGQDIYGQWQIASTNGTIWNQTPRASVLGVVKLIYQLYLAPDRLIYNGHIVMHISQIRHVDLYEKSKLHKLNPFNEDLLRIEYEQDEKHHVAGFLVRNGRQWAAALQARLNIPVEVHEGRKKK